MKDDNKFKIGDLGRMINKFKIGDLVKYKTDDLKTDKGVVIEMTKHPGIDDGGYEYRIYDVYWFKDKKIIAVMDCRITKVG